MKNLTIIILTGFIAITSLSAKNIDEPKAMTGFFYKKGYKIGYTDGYEAGYKAAINDVLKKLSKYETKMKAIEAGKYLLATGQITYPQVYKVSTPQGYKIVIIPPKVENTLSLNSLITIPFADNICSYLTKNQNKYSNPNAFSLQNQNSIVNTGIVSVKKINNQTVLHFPKTQKIFEILQNSNLPFVENANDYTVYFNNIEQERNFCKNVGGEICSLAH